MGKLTLMFGLIAALTTPIAQEEVDNFGKSADDLKKGSKSLLYFIEEGDKPQLAARAIYRVVIVDDTGSDDEANKLKFWELPPANIQWSVNEQSIKKDSKKPSKEKE